MRGLNTNSIILTLNYNYKTNFISFLNFNVCFQIENVLVRCICRLPWFQEDDLHELPSWFLLVVCCNICKLWYHVNCEKIPEAVVKDRALEWYCSDCRDNFKLWKVYSFPILYGFAVSTFPIIIIFWYLWGWNFGKWKLDREKIIDG